ncbi:MAG: DNA double-strand break repair nuclease NurA [Candidatus Diapherotrites archaeon]|nr:DNA double-strand break repair nuclease NurA [Candidatus Diapherotrites archaeon]
MELDGWIAHAVERLKDSDARLRELSMHVGKVSRTGLRALNSPFVLEDALIQAVPSVSFTGKVAGVDSGFLDRALYVLDILLVKSVGVVFEYQGNRLVKSVYYPRFFQFPKPEVSAEGLERDEVHCSVSLTRLREEVRVAREIIERHSPQFLFLDGSLVPQFMDKPGKDSKVKVFYHEVLNDFQLLFQTAFDHECTLVGAVEDSRGNRFRALMEETIFPGLGVHADLGSCKDASLLEYVLSPGERTLAFSYAQDVSKHPVLADMNEKWARALHALYVKPSAYDRPLRVEFLCHDLTQMPACAGEVAGIALNQSSLHKEYAFPAVLIEADLRARLKPEEVDWVFERIMQKLGRKNFWLQRRDKRPF